MVSMRISMEQSLKCHEVGFEMAIYWYRVAKGHKVRRICSQGSYCIGFYLSGRRLYLTRITTNIINWTWQDTFDAMTTILVTDYCCTALYLAIPQAHVINFITWLIRPLIRK